MAPRERVACVGQAITAIEIDARPPFPPGEGTIIARTGQAARKMHSTTKPEVVRRYLALRLGDRCEELRRAESERILRAQPFISEATVIPLSDGEGGVILSVTTVDEISLIVGGSVSASSPFVRSVKLGNKNFFGSGLHASLRWEDGRDFRDSYTARVTDYQFMGRPYQLTVEGGRLQLGKEWLVDASHPFLTDLQRIAWRVAGGEQDRYARFRRPGADPAYISVDREYAEAGGVVRIGPIGRFLLTGGSVTRERIMPGEAPVRIIGGDLAPDTSTALIGRYAEQRQARLNALFGARIVNFMEVVGFDALDAKQDVRKGLQFGVMVGRGIKLLDTKSDEDFFASVSAYAGMGSPSAFSAMELNVEGRRKGSEDNWNSVLSSGRFAMYMRPFTRHIATTSLEWSGGWRSRVPYQVTFASRDGGLRGFRNSQVGGARRLVLRAEDKYVWGRFRKYATVGVAAFADAGKIWAGDSPFGVETPIRYSAGVGLLVAVPPRSRRLARLDLAYPINPDGRRRPELRVTVRDFGRIFWKEPTDFQLARERSRPASVFNWP
ncbi:MAG TPA: hypothetical protein VMY38_05660 [Gemmatimonadaceae bacterium]|nr:hypothetical protein [Gemmatimonadaceae bacterium]